MSVSCETCHGQGSRHVAWARDRHSWWPLGQARQRVRGPCRSLRRACRHRLADRSGDRAPAAQSAAGAVAQRGRDLRAVPRPPRELFRRVGARPLAVGHPCGRVARRTGSITDGQMQDEVYNYGWFKQSRMFAAGVTCSDCHDPHSGKLKVSGDGACLQCHAAAPTPPQPTPITPRSIRRSPARPATCRRALTRSSTAGTIAVFGCRDRIYRPSSARRTRATRPRTRRPHGRQRPSNGGTSRSAKVFRTMPRPFKRPGTRGLMRQNS